MIIKAEYFIIICVIHSVTSKPFLGNFLLQAASFLSASTPDDPQSHVSDFRTQPKANSRADRYEVDPSDDSDNDTTTEQTRLSTSFSTAMEAPPNRDGFRLVPWRQSNNGTEMYSEIIGNIIGSARERISIAFQRFLSPLQRQQDRSRQFIESGAATINGTGSVKNKVSEEDVVLNPSSVSDTDLKREGEIEYEHDDPETTTNQIANSLESIYQMTNENIAQVESTSEFVELALPIEESHQPKVSFQLDSDYAFETNESANASTRPEKWSLAKRLENISKQLNETRNQFRARTIQAVASLVPLLRLVAEGRGHGIVNSLETETTSGSLENYGTAKNNEENNFPLPPHLSRLSNNLLALNPNSKERATLAFQNAFNKYARLVINGKNASTGDRNSIPNKSEQKEGNDNYSTDDAGGVVAANKDEDDDGDDDNDGDYEDKDDIAGSSRIGAGEEVIDNNVPSRASYISATKRMNMQSIETVGILILEVFGSIAGLTWGAYNQLQLLFQ